MLSGFNLGIFFVERYRIEDMLGRGAMAKVYAATDTLQDRRVALKVLNDEMLKKEEALARFRREARILHELGHPGIVQVLDSGQTPEGVDFLVMELLQGRDLSQLLSADGPMSPQALLPILVQVCGALEAAHAQGVIHRDLKPDNLFLIEGDKTAKLIDFGLSHMETAEKNLTAPGAVIGTPRYMAPEQIRSAKDVDERTDQYALAIIAHEALAGASPFPASDNAQLLGCVITGRVNKLEETRQGIPPALGAVVRRAMSVDPNQRYATIGAFVEAFAEAIGGATGRGGLANDSGINAALAESSSLEPAAGAAVELPDMIVSAHHPPRFTAPPPVPMPVAKKAPSKGGMLGWAILALTFVVAICFSASLAIGWRTWFG